MTLLRSPFFYRTFLFVLLAELFSLFAYLLPSFSPIAFVVIALLVCVIAIVRLEYGIYILLTELFIGSKGFLFYYEIDGAIISLRIVLWLIVMGVWFTRFLTLREERQFWKEQISRPISRWFFVLLLVVLLAAVNGFIRNSVSDMFFDLNGWFFFFLFFPLLSAFQGASARTRILEILFAATLFTSFKALVILFVYAHDPLGALFLPLYRWVRNSGVGEVTALTSTFSRVFFQSQVYTVIAFFLIAAEKRMVLFSSILFSSILLSFSRSFWLAGIATLSLFFFWILLQKDRREIFFRKAATILAIGIFGFSIVWITMNFPYPKTLGGSFASLVEDRATTSEEAGLSSRWSLLPPLLDRIRENWLLGAGFGATVTYQSSDPRIVQSTAHGNNFYTTYAFEWGYLDLWLKLGLIGLFFYLVFLWKIGSILMQSHSIGLFLGFLALLLTNVFSPYLNHPLGIGYLLLCIAFTATQKEVHILSSR